jgi:hypothetical protein
MMVTWTLADLITGLKALETRASERNPEIRTASYGATADRSCTRSEGGASYPALARRRRDQILLRIGLMSHAATASSDLSSGSA